MLNINKNIPTSVADRIRSATDEEMAKIIVDYCIGVVNAILKDTDYTLTPDTTKCASIVKTQLQTATTKPPRAYTLDEMKEMRGQMVYIHYIGPCKGFYTDEYMPFFGDDEIGIKLINDQYARMHMPLSLYNKSWVALAYRPNKTK